MSEKTIWMKGMPPIHSLANMIWTKVFNWRHNSDFKDVGCSVVWLSREALYKIGWDDYPEGASGYIFEAWLKKQILKYNIKYEQVPIDVQYEIKKVSMKKRLDKYNKMFFGVLIECLKK